MQISEILGDSRRQVVTATSRDTIGDIVYQLREHGIGAIVVSDDRQSIQGIISERDIVRNLAHEQEGTLRIPVEELMTVNVHTATVDQQVDDVMSIMTEGRFRHMPLVDGQQNLIGIISMGDLVLAKLNELRAMNSELQSKVEG